MKVAISGFIDSIPRSPDSHYRGWMELCAQAMRLEIPNCEVEVLTGPDSVSRWKEFDKVAVHHGLYYYGDEYSLNLFGGMNPGNTQKILEAFEALHAKDDVISLEYPWPKGIYDSIIGRLDSKSIDSPRLRSLIESTRERYFVHYDPWLDTMTKRSTHITMGDSHCGAAKPNYPSVLFRNDRETLFGACRRGFKEKIEARFPGWRPRTATFLYGNIDVRHHLCRQPDPKKAAADLVKSYFDQIAKLGLESAEICCPYNIENESRRMSKSVYFKGTPFFGSWKERDEVRKAFCHHVITEAWNMGLKVVDLCPPDYLNVSGELKFDVMEKPQSIHLSPRFYRTPLFQEKKESIEEFFS